MICQYCGTDMEVEEEMFSQDRFFKEHSCRGDNNGLTKRFELTQQDKVEAVKKLLTPYLASPHRHADMLAREILKLFPEYEPVGLEALGHEKIADLNDGVYTNYGSVISQATIQKNQAKGQLFRLKEE